MGIKFIIEFNEQRRVLSLDEFTKSFLEAVQRIVRQELERLLASRLVSAEQRMLELEVNRPVAVSRVEAARTLGVSLRTIDNCIARERIHVLRIGRRVLVPLNSLETAIKRGALETHGNE